MKKSFLLIVLALFVSQAAFGQGGEENKVLWEKKVGNGIGICKFMPDDNFIINKAHDLLQIRRTEDCELVRETNIGWQISDFDITPDGKYVIICGGNHIKVLDANTLEFIRDIHPPLNLFDSLGAAVKVAISPDGSKFAVIARGEHIPLHDHWNLLVFDFKSVQMLKEIVNKDDEYWKYVKFSPDGKYIAVAMAFHPYSVRIYDANTYELYWEPSNDGEVGGRIKDMRFSHDSKMLAMGNGFPGSVLRVYDLNNKRTIINLEKEEYFGLSIKFTKDNSKILLGRQKIPFYDIKSKKIHYLFEYDTKGWLSLDLNKNGNLLIGCTLNRIIMHQINSYTSVEDNTKNIKNSLFPNPTDNTISLDYELNYPSDIDYSIINLIGKQVKQNDLGFFEPGNHELIINIGELPTGAYFLRIITIKDSVTYKFVKE